MIPSTHGEQRAGRREVRERVVSVGAGLDRIAKVMPESRQYSQNRIGTDSGSGFPVPKSFKNREPKMTWSDEKPC